MNIDVMSRIFLKCVLWKQMEYSISPTGAKENYGNQDFYSISFIH